MHPDRLGQSRTDALLNIQSNGTVNRAGSVSLIGLANPAMFNAAGPVVVEICLLYTSDAADD